MRCCAFAKQKSSPTPVSPPVEAANADEAFAILENRSGTALLYTDIQMDGLDLARTVHDRWPAIEIILVSGQVEMSERERPANSRFY